jgi:hypothetical protein
MVDKSAILKNKIKKSQIKLKKNGLFKPFFFLINLRSEKKQKIDY